MKLITSPNKTIKTGINNIGNQMGDLNNAFLIHQIARIRTIAMGSEVKYQ